MNTFVMATVAVAMALLSTTSASVIAAPLTLPAAFGYAHAVPQNIPPFASRVDISSRVRAAPFVAAAAAPIVAAAPALPYAAAPALPYAAAPGFPYINGPFLRR
ncbi:hypothetical protein TSAR_015383 [Trichomalopsis sarcophagae]|uniref:Uncharacterized protein n=1 Tax=Trichomalopsis sarcophagae TaxID=543379 RepID=A0A232EST9_9HYME|nr:hypothetical protein TSAR_015383 [Trichomalopsis sarcophagae]